jgi:hypothetical protein
VTQVLKIKAEVAYFCDKAAVFAKEGKGEKPTLLVSIAAMPYKCPPMPFEVHADTDTSTPHRDNTEMQRVCGCVRHRHGERGVCERE